MIQTRRSHLRRKLVFGDDHAQLYVSAPITQGENGAHDHDFVEIVLVIEGSGTHVSSHGVQAIKRGDFFVVRPGAWHAYQNCADLLVYNCCCAPELLRRELALLGEDATITRLLWTEPCAPGRHGILYRQLTESQTENAIAAWEPLLHATDDSFIIRAGRLLVLLGQLGEIVCPDESRQNNCMHIAVREGVRLLEEGYAEEWSLARLAELTRLNPSYLARLFKSATGFAPMEYLARHRAELAAKLLLSTEHPIGEIGARVGLRDPNYFARRFKSVFGITPTNYRNRQQNS